MNLKPLVAATLLALACNVGQSANTNWGQHGVLRSALGLSSGGAIAETFSFSLDQTSIVSSLLNLTGSWAAVPRCDLVLLRNVLIYFSLDVKRRMWARQGERRQA